MNHSQLYQQFLEGAVAIELAHGASLVHDDIIDGDLTQTRRTCVLHQDRSR